MEVHYRNTPDDIAALLRSFPLIRRIWWRAGWLVVVIICCLPATIIMGLLGYWAGLAIAWITVLTGSIVSGIASARKNFMSRAPWMHPMTIRLQPDWLECESDRGFSRRLWSEIHRIHDGENHVLLFVGKATAFVIPKRSFAPPELAEQFVSKIRQYQERKNAEPTPPTLPEDLLNRPVSKGAQKIVSSGFNLSVPDSMTIKYEVTANQYASVMFDGLQKAEKANWPMGSFLFTLPFWILGLMLIYFGNGTHWPSQILVALLIFMLTGIPTILAVSKLQKLRTIQTFDDTLLGTKSVTVARHGISTWDASSAAFFRWTQIGGIDADYRFLVFYFAKPHIACLIPKSEFHETRAASDFEKLARKFKQLSDEEELPHSPERGPIETGNPYQPPAAY